MSLPSITLEDLINIDDEIESGYDDNWEIYADDERAGL